MFRPLYYTPPFTNRLLGLCSGLNFAIFTQTRSGDGQRRALLATPPAKKGPKGIAGCLGLGFHSLLRVFGRNPTISRSFDNFGIALLRPNPAVKKKKKKVRLGWTHRVISNTFDVFSFRFQLQLLSMSLHSLKIADSLGQRRDFPVFRGCLDLPGRLTDRLHLPRVG